MNVHLNIICRVMPAPVPASNWNKREIILVSLCAVLIFASLAFNLFSFQKNRILQAKNNNLEKDNCNLNTENNALKNNLRILSTEHSKLQEESLGLAKNVTLLVDLGKTYKAHVKKLTEEIDQISKIYSH